MSLVTLPEGDWIRGISIRQPYAACILAGAKTIENRPGRWRTGWVLLHASKTIDQPALRNLLIGRTIRGRELVRGAVVGIVRITDCHRDPERRTDLLGVGAPRRLAPGPRRRPGAAAACPRTGAGRALEADRAAAGPRVPAAARIPAVTRPGRMNKEPPFEPGLIPAPGELLVWRDGRHFDRWQDLPSRLCGQPTPMRSHSGEPVHKACAEDWITAKPVEARLGRFASDLTPKPKSKGQGDHS